MRSIHRDTAEIEMWEHSVCSEYQRRERIKGEQTTKKSSETGRKRREEALDNY